MNLAVRENGEEYAPATLRDLSWMNIGGGYWYLATPYSKYPAGIKAAWVAACRCTAKLIAAGVRVYSPIAHTHPVAVYGGLDPLDHSIWLPADKPLMDAAAGLIVAMLPTWESSFGIAVEIREFQKAGKPVAYIAAEEFGE